MTHTEEEKYFRAENAQLRARLRRKLENAARKSGERMALSEHLEDRPSAIERIQELGFDDDTGRVFDLLPLVHVAWADGSVSLNERARILEAVTNRGISDESEAYHLIETLLEERPTQSFLDETLDILKELFEKNDARVRRIVDLCVEVAKASGGFLGFGSKVSQEENVMLQHIADILGPVAKREFELALN